MSMIDVAKFLCYSRSVDLSREEGRYFRVSKMDKKRAFPLLQIEGTSQYASSLRSKDRRGSGMLLFGRRR